MLRYRRNVVTEYRSCCEKTMRTTFRQNRTAIAERAFFKELNQPSPYHVLYNLVKVVLCKEQLAKTLDIRKITQILILSPNWPFCKVVICKNR